MLLRRGGLTASAGLSCMYLYFINVFLKLDGTISYCESYFDRLVLGEGFSTTRVGIARGWAVEPRSSCLQTLIFE